MGGINGDGLRAQRHRTSLKGLQDSATTRLRVESIRALDLVYRGESNAWAAATPERLWQEYQVRDDRAGLLGLPLPAVNLLPGANKDAGGGQGRAEFFDAWRGDGIYAADGRGQRAEEGGLDAVPSLA